MANIQWYLHVFWAFFERFCWIKIHEQKRTHFINIWFYEQSADHVNRIYYTKNLFELKTIAFQIFGKNSS